MPAIHGRRVRSGWISETCIWKVCKHKQSFRGVLASSCGGDCLCTCATVLARLRCHQDCGGADVSGGGKLDVRVHRADRAVVVLGKHGSAVRVEQRHRGVRDVAGGVADVGPDVVGLAGGEVDLEVLAVGVLDITVDNAAVGGNLDLAAASDYTAVCGAVAVVTQEDVAVDCAPFTHTPGRKLEAVARLLRFEALERSSRTVEPAILGVGAVVAEAVAEPCGPQKHTPTGVIEARRRGSGRPGRSAHSGGERGCRCSRRRAGHPVAEDDIESVPCARWYGAQPQRREDARACEGRAQCRAESHVVHAVEQVDHLVDGQCAAAVIVEEGVQRLELLQVELLQVREHRGDGGEGTCSGPQLLRVGAGVGRC